MKRKAKVVVLLVAVAVTGGWGGWLWLLARTGPVVRQLPVLVRGRLAAHAAPYVPLADIPPMLWKAVVATEDRSFWTNAGVDPESIIRSALVDVYYGRFVEGGSTITQQLARDMLLNPHKTLLRKAKEMLLALVITHYFGKNAILTMYLNEIYLGHGAWGVAQAARVYFGTAPARLTPAQCTLLAGLPRGPSLYDPLTHLAAARARQRQVLDNMVDVGYLTAGAARRIYAGPLGLSRG